MEFLADIGKLEARQRERFREVVTRLLGGEVLSPGSPLKPDPDWRFAENHRELIDAYLRVGGWRFEIDLGLRLARAVHEEGRQRVRFSKLESLLLCSLRLLYHEQMRSSSDEDRCEIEVGALRERLVHAGRPIAQLSSRALAPALRKLARHSLVDVARGFEAQDNEMVIVLPLVEKVLPPDRIAEMSERVKAYVAARSRQGSTETPESAGAPAPPNEDAEPDPSDEADEDEGDA